MKNVNEELKKAMAILDDIDIPYGPIVSVVVNSRAQSRWGRCSQVVGGYRIEINECLLQDDVSNESTMNTLVHELLHAYPGRMCHTGEWKKCAEFVNDCYSFLNIKRCTSAEEKGIEQHITKNYKYLVTCSDCGRKYRYQRRSSVIQALEKDSSSCKCCCGSCNLNLERI